MLAHDRRLRPLPRPQVRPDPARPTTTRCTASSSAPSSPTEKPLIGRPPDAARRTRTSSKQARRARAEEPRHLLRPRRRTSPPSSARRPTSTCWSSVYRQDTSADEIQTAQQADRRATSSTATSTRTLRVIRAGTPVFGPLIRFAQLPPTSSSPSRRRAHPRRDRPRHRSHAQRPDQPARRQGVRRTLPPDSLTRPSQDVADVYGKLFAEIDAEAKAYLDACRNATTATDVDRLRPATWSSCSTAPPRSSPPRSSTTEHLLEIVAARLPRQQQQGATSGSPSTRSTSSMLTHPGCPARAMVVADSPKPRNSPIFIRGEAQNRGPVVPRQFLEILSGQDRQALHRRAAAGSSSPRPSPARTTR